MEEAERLERVEQRLEFLCPKCEEAFTPDEARTVVISGPDVARYTCPRCGHGTDGPPPILDTES